MGENINDTWKDQELLEEVYLKYLKQKSPISRKFMQFKIGLKRGVWRVIVRSAYILKRVLDIVVSLIALFFLSPVFLFTWLAIKIEDPGPTIFKQIRVGQWGKTFIMYKFRCLQSTEVILWRQSII